MTGEKIWRDSRLLDRRSMLKGLSATCAALSGVTMLPGWSVADEYAAMYSSAAIDWKRFSGQTIQLAAAIHPWSKAIGPLLPQFTELTGIKVVTDFRLETDFLGALQIKLARGSTTPDVFMFYGYGQAIAAGWLEPLNAYYADQSLIDPVWYDEDDLLKTARAYPLWADGDRYAFPITSEAMTLFLNRNALAAKDAPIPQTFDELLATAKSVKTNDMSGIAMRAGATGDSSAPPMGFVFSYGGTMVRDNKAAFDSPEAIAAIDMYGRLLREAGPPDSGNYDWYRVLNDFLQGKTAMAIDSSNFATDISNPAKSRVAGQAAFGVFPHVAGRAPVPYVSHWQASINAKSQSKKAAFLFMLWATSKPTSLQTGATGLATTRISAWSSETFRNAFGPEAAAAAQINLQHGNIDLTKAVIYHTQSSIILDAFMIGVNEVVSGTKSAGHAMTRAAAKANAAIPG